MLAPLAALRARWMQKLMQSPRVGFVDSANPGLNDSTPLVLVAELSGGGSGGFLNLPQRRRGTENQKRGRGNSRNEFRAPEKPSKNRRFSKNSFVSGWG